MFKVFALIVLASAEEVYSLPRAPDTMTILEMWNPFTWWYPFGIVQAETWSNYLKEAERASNRLYRLVQSYIKSVLFNGQILNGNKVKDQGLQKNNRTTTPLRIVEDLAPVSVENAGEDTPGTERPTTREISSADRWK